MTPAKYIERSPDPQKNLQLIQVLRGIASLLVMLFHATKNLSEIKGQSFAFDFFSFGGAGVDIFFVLSGFIITYTSFKAITHPNQALPFIRRRFIRIFPAYWIIIVLFVIVQLLLPAFYKTHFEFSFNNILSTLFLLPGHTMVNGVSWTLTYELFFYLLFSLAFVIPKKKWTFSFFAVYAVVIIAVPLSGHNLEHGNEWITLLTYPMNIEFLMGVIAAIIIPYIPPRTSLALIIGGAILFLAGGIFSNQGHFLLADTYNRVVLFGLPSFLIICGLVRFELSRQLVVHNVFLLLGEASYSIYLLHLPLLAAGIKLAARFNIENNLILHFLLICIMVVICFGAVLFYKLIENPLLISLKNQKGPDKFGRKLETGNY